MAYVDLSAYFSLGATPPPVVYSPTATRVAVAVSPAALPSSPIPGGLAIDSGDGNKLKWWNGSSWQTAGGGAGGTPAGSDTEIQFNNAGSFGASANLTFASQVLGVNGGLSVTGGDGALITTPEYKTGIYFNLNHTMTSLDYRAGAVMACVADITMDAQEYNGLVLSAKVTNTTVVDPTNTTLRGLVVKDVVFDGTFNGATVIGQLITNINANVTNGSAIGLLVSGVVGPSDAATRAIQTDGRIQCPVLQLAGGAAPASPVDGDLWVTASGLFAQVNGSTVGPFATSVGIGGSISSGQVAVGSGTNTLGGSSALTYSSLNGITITQPVNTTGTPHLLTLVGAANTTLTGGETRDVDFQLARTVQITGGNYGNQRVVYIQRPIYAYTSATQVTVASTLSIQGPPGSGANATFVTSCALDIEAGLLRTAASGTTGAGFRLPHGAAPSSPVNGDIWTTTNGLYARINGSTVGPFSAGAGISGTIAASQVAYGTGADTVGGSANLTYDATLSTGGLTLANTTAATSSTTGALKVSGGVGIAGNVVIAIGNTTTPAIAWNGASTSGLFSIGAGATSISIANTERVRFSASTFSFLTNAGTVNVNPTVIGTAIDTSPATVYGGLSGQQPFRCYITRAVAGTDTSIFGHAVATANGPTMSGVYGLGRVSGGDGRCVGVIGQAIFEGAGGGGMSSAVGGAFYASTANQQSGKVCYGIDVSATSSNSSGGVSSDLTGIINAVSITGTTVNSAILRGIDSTVTSPSAWSGSTLQGIKITNVMGGTASAVNGQTVIGIDLAMTVNQNAANTGAYTAIKANVTQTAVGTGAKSLLDLLVGGVSQFNVSNTGLTTIADTTEASSTTLASLVTAGGIGSAKAIIGGSTIKATTFYQTGTQIVVVASTTTTITAGKVRCTGTTAGQTLTLPAGVAGMDVYIKNDSSVGVTLDGNGAETIQGAATMNLPAGTAALLTYIDSTWVLY